MQLPYDPAIALLDIYSRGMQTCVHTETYTQIFIAALLVIAKKSKQHRCPSIDGWSNCATSLSWNTNQRKKMEQNIIAYRLVESPENYAE